MQTTHYTLTRCPGCWGSKKSHLGEGPCPLCSDDRRPVVQAKPPRKPLPRRAPWRAIAAESLMQGVR